jgi:hypothetical protein
VLNVPSGVDVRKVDLSIELQILAFHAQRRAVVRVAGHGERDWGARGDRNRGDGNRGDSNRGWGGGQARRARRPGGRGSAGTGDMPMDGETGVAAQAVAT